MAAPIAGRHPSTLLLVFDGEPLAGVVDLTIESHVDEFNDVDAHGGREIVRSRSAVEVTIRHDALDPPTIVPAMRGAQIVSSKYLPSGDVEERIVFTDRLLIIDREREKLTRIVEGRAVHGNASPTWRPLPWRCMPAYVKDRLRIHHNERLTQGDVDGLIVDLNATTLALLATNRRAEAATAILDVLPPCPAVDFLIAAGAELSAEWEGDRQRCSPRLSTAGDPLHLLATSAWRVVRAVAIELAYGAHSPEAPCMNGQLVDAIAFAIRHVTLEGCLVSAEDIAAVALPPRRGWARAHPCVRCACTGELTRGWVREIAGSPLYARLIDTTLNAPAGFRVANVGRVHAIAGGQILRGDLIEPDETGRVVRAGFGREVGVALGVASEGEPVDVEVRATSALSLATADPDIGFGSNTSGDGVTRWIGEACPVCSGLGEIHG